MKVYAELHDATLDGLSVDWKSGVLRIMIKTESARLELRAVDLERLVCPRRNDWGKSVSINEVRGPFALTDKTVRLEIEMQSGDVIEVDARQIELLEL